MVSFIPSCLLWCPCATLLFCTSVTSVGVLAPIYITHSLVVFWRVHPNSSALWMIHREEIHAHGPSIRHEVVVLAHGMPKSRLTWQAAVETDVHLQLQSIGLVSVPCYIGLWESCSAGMHMMIVLLTDSSTVELILKFLGPSKNAFFKCKAILDCL